MSLALDSVIDEKFNQWVRGKDAVAARISVFEGIREIPYAVVPELIDAGRYAGILELGRGSCSPKHFLLCEMFRRLGLPALFVGRANAGPLCSHQGPINKHIHI